MYVNSLEILAGIITLTKTVWNWKINNQHVLKKSMQRKQIINSSKLFKQILLKRFIHVHSNKVLNDIIAVYFFLLEIKIQ